MEQFSKSKYSILIFLFLINDSKIFSISTLSNVSNFILFNEEHFSNIFSVILFIIEVSPLIEPICISFKDPKSKKLSIF